MAGYEVTVVYDLWKVELQGDGVVRSTYVTPAAHVAVSIAAIQFAISGRPLEGELIIGPVLADAITLLAGVPGSQAFAGTSATDSATFSVRDKTDTQIGTVVFAVGQSVGTFQGFNVDLALAIGERISLKAPLIRDATLADISITIRGVR